MPLRALRRFPFFRLLLAAFIGWMWSRSHTHTDVLALFLHDGKAQLLAADRGRAILLTTNISFGSSRSYTYDYLTGPNADFDEQRQTLYEKPPVPEHIAGVWIGRSHEDVFNALPNSRFRMISVPFWQVAIAIGVPLLLGLRTFWKRRFWGAPGCCSACGYDIRYSSGRCPECGADIPAAAPATAAA
jgi:hypothetical protein